MKTIYFIKEKTSKLLVKIEGNPKKVIFNFTVEGTTLSAVKEHFVMRESDFAAR